MHFDSSFLFSAGSVKLQPPPMLKYTVFDFPASPKIIIVQFKQIRKCD
ncbi:unnamed protein product, partial [Larinioides sclopetarius]